MEIQKITYDTKKYIRNDPNYPKTQTITDEDMNEIKSVVNNNAYKQDEDYLKLKNAALNAETEESKSLYVTDANKFGQLEVFGNQEQETREGYNFLQNNLTDTTINGVTFKINEDKSVTVNGTATASIIANLTTGEFEDGSGNVTNFTIPNDVSTLKLTGCPSGGSSSSYKLDLWNSHGVLKGTDYGEGTNISISSDNDRELNRARIIIYSGATVNNLTFKPMLVAGTEEKEYEQYGVSPSPEYPSEVKCLGSNKNELDLKAQSQYGITVTKNADDTLNITGTATASGNLSLLNKNIVLKANKSYTFSVKKISGQDISNSIWFWNATDSNSEITLTLSNNIKTFTFTKDTTLSALNISVNQGAVFDITLALKVEEGTEATSYSPYNQGSTKISKINKNIYDIAKYPFTNRIAYNSSGEQVFWTGYCGILDYFPVKGNTQYTFSNNLNKPIYCGLVFYNKDKQVISAISTNTTTFTTPENCKYIRFAIQSDTLPTWVQIELGNTATSNIEHKQTDYLLYIQQEMLQGDYFVKEDDGWKEVHYWDKIVFTGNENWSKSSTTIMDRFLFNISDMTPINNYNNLDIYSNYFKPGAYNNSELGYIWHNGKNLAVNYSDYNTTTLEEFKSKLQELYNAGNSVYAFYKLETPTKLPCTEEQSAVLEELNNLELFEGVNNIITAEDIALLKLKYALDVKTYVDNQLANVNAQILNIAGGN